MHLSFLSCLILFSIVPAFAQNPSVSLTTVSLSGDGIRTKDFPFSPAAVDVDATGKVHLAVQTRPYSGLDEATPDALKKHPERFPSFMLARYDRTGKNKEFLTYDNETAADFPERLRVDANGTLWISGRTNSLSAPQPDSVPENPQGRAYFLAHLNPDGTEIKSVRPFNLFSRLIDFHINKIGDLVMLGEYQGRPALVFYNTRSEDYENVFFLPPENRYEAFVPHPSGKRLFYLFGTTEKGGQASENAFQKAVVPLRQAAFSAVYDVENQKFRNFTYLTDFGMPFLPAADGSGVCFALKTPVFKRLSLLPSSDALYKKPAPYAVACLPPELSGIGYFSFLPSEAKALVKNGNALKVVIFE